MNALFYPFLLLLVIIPVVAIFWHEKCPSCKKRCKMKSCDRDNHTLEANGSQSHIEHAICSGCGTQLQRGVTEGPTLPYCAISADGMFPSPPLPHLHYGRWEVSPTP